jgi:YeeE/YedE family (DUF395).
VIENAWINGFLGGLLIGGAGALYLLLNGRIMGMSGLIKNVLALKTDETGRLSGAFVIGAFGAAWLFAQRHGAPEVVITTNVFALIVSGVIVGVGVSYGSGCTSGHGVIGMTRFSLRSILATLTFMAATAATVYEIRHMLGLVY